MLPKCIQQIRCKQLVAWSWTYASDLSQDVAVLLSTQSVSSMLSQIIYLCAVAQVHWTPQVNSFWNLGSTGTNYNDAVVNLVTRPVHLCCHVHSKHISGVHVNDVLLQILRPETFRQGLFVLCISKPSYFLLYNICDTLWYDCIKLKQPELWDHTQTWWLVMHQRLAIVLVGCCSFIACSTMMKTASRPLFAGVVVPSRRILPLGVLLELWLWSLTH